MMLVEMFFENIFLKSYLLGCFQKFYLSKITRYTVYHGALLATVGDHLRNNVVKTDLLY